MNVKRTIYERGMLMDKNLAKKVTASQLRTDLPEFKSGDTVKVSVRIT